MQVLPAKRQEESCTGRYSKGLRSQTGEHLCDHKTLMKLGMSSLFINLILRTRHYFHMNVLNERISKWAHLFFYHKGFSRYLYLKFEKEVIFLERFSPSEIPESRDKIFNF